MDRFDTYGKNLPGYLDIAANGNGNEKASLMLEAARRIIARDESTTIRSLEVGPGGGTAIQSLAKLLPTVHPNTSLFQLSLLELDGIESEALRQSREALEQIGASTEFKKGNLVDVAQLFPDQLDIISTSAVLHEVYSYGEGYTAVDDAVCGITASLKDGGYYAYRDVFGVENLSQHDRTRHIYDRRAWVSFSKLFLDYYLQNARHPYHHLDDRINFKQDGHEIKLKDVKTNAPLSIEGPVGITRELQRHYITFRDHVWRGGSLGIKPVLDGPEASDWIDMRRGHKRVHYELLGYDPALVSLSTHSEQDKYIVDGDIFDQTTDALLGEILDDIAANHENSEYWAVWNSWLEREGAETYVYMTLNQLIGNIALRSFNSTQGDSILLPIHAEDVAVVPRAYYNRYLENKLSNPLPDGKQMVLFEKISLEATMPSEKRLLSGKVTSSLEVLGAYCSQEMLSAIYEPLRKALR